MPAKLERKSESSAWAICRSSLGLTKTALAPGGPIYNNLQRKAAAIEWQHWPSPRDTFINDDNVHSMFQAEKVFSAREAKLKRIRADLARLNLRTHPGAKKKVASGLGSMFTKAMKMFTR
jgi:hypothetical protein